MELRVLEIHGGERCPQHVTVAVPVFRNRQPLAEAKLKLGDVVRLRMTPLAATPGPSISMYEMADDIEDLHLPLYYTEECATLNAKVADFPARAAGYFANQESADPQQPTERHLPYPAPPEARKMREEEIARDRQVILDALRRHGGDWAGWAQELQPFHADLHQQIKENGGIMRRGNMAFSRIPHDGYEELAKEAETGQSGPLRMLRKLNEQLHSRGIDLIVVPFPHKDVVQAGHFSDLAPEDGLHSPWRQKFFLHLLEAGIEVVDLVPPLQRNESGHRLLYYDAHDLHPADGGIQIAAEEIARRLKRYAIDRQPGFQAEKFAVETVTFNIHDDLKAKGFPQDGVYSATQVLHSNGRLVEIGDLSNSPVIVMGDSFTVCPAPEVPGASLPAHLARHLGHVPCQLLTLGSSHKTMRTLAREGVKFFSNRCAVVFVFGPTRLFGNVSRTAGGGWDLYDLPPLRLD